MHQVSQSLTDILPELLSEATNLHRQTRILYMSRKCHKEVITFQEECSLSGEILGCAIDIVDGVQCKCKR